MATVDAGSMLQSAIQAAVQPKLMENGWVVEENDTTLSEYVTMMIVNGKDLQGVQSELGGDLLGVGADDPAVGEFTRWLFDMVNQLSAPQQQQQQQNEISHQGQPHPIPTVHDSQMEDTQASADTPPTGPKSMRSGAGQGRGRAGRMLGQMNRSMDRSTDLPDNLRRIKGAAGGQSGRINAHASRDAPRGPKANGIQRMMNGGRGGNQGNMNAVSSMMNGGQLTPQAQMQFMQMMEMSAQMMAQAMQQNGFQPGNNTGFQRGGARGGRGARGGNRGNRSQQADRKEIHAVDGKMPDVALSDTKGSGMEMDTEDGKGDKFSTMCRFNLSCTVPTCPFAHQSPAAPPNTAVDMADTCSYGAACTNHKCSARHPSPAQRSAHNQEVDCKYYPNCTMGANCAFRHPTERPCRNGGDCTVPNCKFAHSKIVCRYNPCTKPDCPFKHAEGQKRGKFEDKVWTANGEGGKADRFADFSKQDEGEEELIIPGQQEGENGISAQNGNSQMETQVTT